MEYDTVRGTIMKAVFRLSLGLIPLLALAGCAASQVHFGEPPRASDDVAIVAGKILAAPGQYDGQAVRVRGTVASVCEAKGCWLRIAGDNSDETIFVKFTCPVDGRLVPMSAVGHEVVVEGQVTVEEISEEEARHYAEDAGESPERIAAIAGPSKRVRMASPGATVYGLNADTVK
jgi:hypothetical protein